MPRQDNVLARREFLTTVLASSAFLQAQLRSSRAQDAPRDVVFERPAEGTPHKGKVLLAVAEG